MSEREQLREMEAIIRQHQSLLDLAVRLQAALREAARYEPSEWSCRGGLMGGDVTPMRGRRDRPTTSGPLDWRMRSIGDPAEGQEGQQPGTRAT